MKNRKAIFSAKEEPTYIIPDGSAHIWGNHWAKYYSGQVMTQIRK